jgi:integrase
VVQSEATRVVFESYVRCLIFYLGDKHLDEIDGAVINEFVERRRRDGAASFTLTKAGAPKRGRTMELKNSALNKPLSVLRAALNLAVKEGVLPVVPRVELLPENDCEALTPPSAAVLAEILAEAENHRAVAPWLPEAIELSVETGLRKGELFNLTWGNVDWDAGPNREGAIIVAEQTRGRLVGGKLWKPKNRRTRMVPLSPRARELLEKIRGDSIPRADALVIPNINASPYERVQSAKKGTGANTWRVMKEAMGHNVRWHDLRHLFAVRCLQANIPISTVSAWLGHSDINLTVKRYGRFAAETHEQWRMMARTGSSAASNARGRG